MHSRFDRSRPSALLPCTPQQRYYASLLALLDELPADFDMDPAFDDHPAANRVEQLLAQGPPDPVQQDGLAWMESRTRSSSAKLMSLLGLEEECTDATFAFVGS